MAVISGDLSSVCLLDVIEEACLMPQSLTANISTPRLKGIIVVKDGRVIHAMSSNQKGEDALIQLLKLKEGDFKLEPSATDFQQTISSEWTSLLRKADAAVDIAEKKDDPEGLGVEPSVGLKPSGEPSEINTLFHSIPGVILATEINEDGKVVDRSGLGNANACQRMASFMLRVAEDLGTVTEMGGATKMAIKGSEVLFVQQGTGNSIISAFFNAKWSPGRAYRSLDRAIMELNEKRKQ
ncbi:MAG: DUF4388 domain-containing protein [Verrucomicrobiota bacterium]